MSIPKFILATAAARGLASFTAGAAGASSDGETAIIVLDELCEVRGGLPVNSPYSIARCQGARANKGFESERLICEGLADGMFTVTVSSTHRNRASWGASRPHPPPDAREPVGRCRDRSGDPRAFPRLAP